MTTYLKKITQQRQINAKAKRVAKKARKERKVTVTRIPENILLSGMYRKFMVVKQAGISTTTIGNFNEQKLTGIKIMYSGYISSDETYHVTVLYLNSQLTSKIVTEYNALPDTLHVNLNQSYQVDAYATCFSGNFITFASVDLTDDKKNNFNNIVASGFPHITLSHVSGNPL